jgi:hypothetical protein
MADDCSLDVLHRSGDRPTLFSATGFSLYAGHFPRHTAVGMNLCQVVLLQSFTDPQGMGPHDANQPATHCDSAKLCNRAFRTPVAGVRSQRALGRMCVIFKITFWRAPMANHTRKNRNSRILDRAAIYVCSRTMLRRAV